MYLDVVFLRIESPVGEQALIDTSQLVYSQIGVADSTSGLPALLLGERKRADNLLPYLVPELHSLELGEIIVVEERGIDLLHGEGDVRSAQRCVMTVSDQLEQGLERVVEEI